MRRISFALALLAAVSMTILPVAPSLAASPKRAATQNELIVKHAAKGDIVVLSPAQMNDLARSHPRLHAKLAAAHAKGTVPKLTASEKRYVRTLTAKNLDAIKAGVNGWVVVAIVAGVLFFLFLLTPIGCGLFPWAPACARPVVASY